MNVDMASRCMEEMNQYNVVHGNKKENALPLRMPLRDKNMDL
jgi:hypothetical protein